MMVVKRENRSPATAMGFFDRIASRLAPEIPTDTKSLAEMLKQSEQEEVVSAYKHLNIMDGKAAALSGVNAFLFAAVAYASSKLVLVVDAVTLVLPFAISICVALPVLFLRWDARGKPLWSKTDGAIDLAPLGHALRRRTACYRAAWASLLLGVLFNVLVFVVSAVM